MIAPHPIDLKEQTNPFDSNPSRQSKHFQELLQTRASLVTPADHYAQSALRSRPAFDRNLADGTAQIHRTHFLTPLLLDGPAFGIQEATETPFYRFPGGR
jgi:hypothetical protein